MNVCCVIPAYRARATVCDVVRNAMRYADAIVVVDDACPEGSGEAVVQAFRNHPSIYVLSRERNGGVGAAVKTGIEKALQLDADVIVKLDADGQMDPSYIPSLVELFENDPNLAYVKGNRFFDSRVLAKMPWIRLFGNSVLSLFAKFASGYWNVLDPTNGYLAFNGHLLPAVNWQGFADCYFFEISVMCEFGLKHASIAEMEMETIYAGESSSLSIWRTLFSFPPKLAWLFLRRHPTAIFRVRHKSRFAVHTARHRPFGVWSRVRRIRMGAEHRNGNPADDGNRHARRAAVLNGLPTDPKRALVRRAVCS